MSWRVRLIVAFFLVAVAVAFGLATFSEGATTVVTSAEQLPELMRRVPPTKWDGVWVQFRYGDHEYGLTQSWVLYKGELKLMRRGGEWFTSKHRDAEFTKLIVEISKLFSAGPPLGNGANAYDVHFWYGEGDDARILRNRQRFPCIFATLYGMYDITLVQVELPPGVNPGPPFTVE